MRGIRSRVLLCALGVLAVITLLAGCSSTTSMTPPNQTAVPYVGMQSQTSTSSASASSAAGHTIISIKATGFKPAKVTVKVGGRVVWENDDKVAHTITLSGGATSGQIEPNNTASHVFSQAGTFKVSDTASPALKGTIVVTKK